MWLVWCLPKGSNAKGFVCMFVVLSLPSLHHTGWIRENPSVSKSPLLNSKYGARRQTSHTCTPNNIQSSYNEFGGKPLFLSSGAATARFLQKMANFGVFWRFLEIFTSGQKPSFPYSWQGFAKFITRTAEPALAMYYRVVLHTLAQLSSYCLGSATIWVMQYIAN